jgi:hypothetical protein
VAGLLALLLLTESRRASRTRPDGSLVLLGDQDRTQWDRALIKEGQTILRRCLRRNQPGPYQLQAAINAVHADAATVEQTDWSQIVALYDQLLAVTPIPVVALNRAIAIGEVHGPAAALALVDQLDLDTYHPYHATRADLLRRLGRNREAAAPTSAQQQWRPQTPSETSSGAVAEPRGQQIGDPEQGRRCAKAARHAAQSSSRSTRSRRVPRTHCTAGSCALPEGGRSDDVEPSVPDLPAIRQQPSLTSPQPASCRFISICVLSSTDVRQRVDAC